jgi:flagellar biosynthesis protein FlhF
MKIKTYVVDDVADAYPLIHNDLGKDAFILKTKPLRKGGILGLFQKKQFEVVAASEGSAPVEKADPKLSGGNQPVEKMDPLLRDLDDQAQYEALSISSDYERAEQILKALKSNGMSAGVEEQPEVKLQEKLERLIDDEPALIKMEEPPVDAPKKRGRPKKVEVIEELIVETPKKKGRPKKNPEPVVEEIIAPAPKKRGRPKKVQTEEQPVETPKKKGRPKKAVEEILEAPTENQTQSSTVEMANPEAHLEVLKELSEVKGLIQAMAQGEQATKMIPKLLEKWVDQLRDQEVDEEVINFIVKRVTMKHPNLAAVPSQTIEQTFLTVLQQLFEEGIDHTHKKQAFIALVGPTGVGKTTTIAKLAAAQVIGQRQKVGLLTTDTFRIAAVEQLKTYANILNVPFKVVGNAGELVPSMKSLNGCDVVFMDSAGRNYLEGEYIEEINQYLRLDVPQENYLVLSMTTRWRDMKKIVEQMKTVPIDKLILTKWDETSCYGVALNMVYHYPYPLSYLCLGQGVPEDIMKADSKFMAKKLLGVDDSETGSSTSIKTII